MSQAMKMQIIQAQPNREAMAPLSRKITSCTLATQIRTCMTTFFFFFFSFVAWRMFYILCHNRQAASCIGRCTKYTKEIQPQNNL